MSCDVQRLLTGAIDETLTLRLDRHKPRRLCLVAGLRDQRRHFCKSTGTVVAPSRTFTDVDEPHIFEFVVVGYFSEQWRFLRARHPYGGTILDCGFKGGDLASTELRVQGQIAVVSQCLAQTTGIDLYRAFAVAHQQICY